MRNIKSEMLVHLNEVFPVYYHFRRNHRNRWKVLSIHIKRPYFWMAGARKLKLTARIEVSIYHLQHSVIQSIDVDKNAKLAIFNQVIQPCGHKRVRQWSTEYDRKYKHPKQRPFEGEPLLHRNRSLDIPASLPYQEHTNINWNLLETIVRHILAVEPTRRRIWVRQRVKRLDNILCNNS